jgi:predicted tellurium resistance membrane protein TerC
MRFKRNDLPGIMIAVLGPVGLMFLILTSYQLWHHHGTPILGMLSVNIAIGGGLLGAFSRFIKARDSLIALLLALILCIGGVLGLQASDNDGTALATLLKLSGVLVFLALNILVVQQILVNGLNPVLGRRDQRRAAAEEQG